MKEKINYIVRELLNIHKQLKETRIASSLSLVDILAVLYYKILNVYPNDPLREERDRVIISKAHGALALYPILADLGFFDKEELKKIGKNFLGSIPDPLIPGFETINGSLGHGVGVGCGIALALKYKKIDSNVVVIVGDGELNEGSIWEGVIFARAKNLNNLTIIVDANKISMQDFSKNILDLEPLEDKFKAFHFDVLTCNGHDIEELLIVLENIHKRDKPKIIIANTIKGYRVPSLENKSLSHVMSLEDDEIDKLLRIFS